MCSKLKGTGKPVGIVLAVLLLLAGCASQNTSLQQTPSLQQPPSPQQSVASASSSWADASLERGNQPAALPENTPDEKMLECLFFERNLFYAGVANPSNYSDQRKLAAGVVPHHLLAADMLSGFFTLAAQHQYDTVVIVAPSHYPEQCESAIVTSTRSWNSPFGPVETDRQLANALLNNGIISAENNPTALELDHGGAGLVPYVAHYLPQTKVVVCLVSAKATEESLTALRQQIFDYTSQKDVLWVTSVDFSHYQEPEQAAMYDAQTEQSIAAFDYRAISRFDSKNVDSPQALAAFLYLTQHLQADLVQLGHSSSQERIPAGRSNPIYKEGITTYFVYGAFVST